MEAKIQIKGKALLLHRKWNCQGSRKKHRVSPVGKASLSPRPQGAALGELPVPSCQSPRRLLPVYPGAKGQAGALSVLGRLQGWPPEPRGCRVPCKWEPPLGAPPIIPEEKTHSSEDIQPPRLNPARKLGLSPISRKEAGGQQGGHLAQGHQQGSGAG